MEGGQELEQRWESEDFGFSSSWLRASQEWQATSRVLSNNIFKGGAQTPLYPEFLPALLVQAADEKQVPRLSWGQIRRL